MATTSTFDRALATVGRLSLDEQESLIEVVQKRIIDARRAQMAGEIREARAEYKVGRCRPVSPSELLAEITS
ncbi:MAG: hypothetical protein A3K19_24320 [Lentisphaerae bacterium RIFOXYB12_FULL_65_16]|nr:MAG: hypothetical protein A3K18_21890 [Lentisphaerae bacterium RIFOXYA12_64_32]OGV93463.1 MAG: hypothetical protein A3K19_24320 [Lentisphaerae bacterium RIFOXYB12_FULL_65_16]